MRQRTKRGSAIGRPGPAFATFAKLVSACWKHRVCYSLAASRLKDQLERKAEQFEGSSGREQNVSQQSFTLTLKVLREPLMNEIIYLVGLVVVIMFILSVLGLR